MCLAGKQEDDRTVGIVDYLAETLQVGEEQMRTLVGGEAAAEADDECVGIEVLDELDHTLRVALVLQPCLFVLHGHIVEEFLLQCLTRFPYLFVGAVVDAVPNLLVRLVAEVLCIEVLGIDFAPFRSAPCGEVNAVGDVADMAFFGIIAVPDAIEHLLADLSVQPTYAVDLLTSVAGKGTHAELLAVVFWISATHSDEFIPADAQNLRVSAHVLAEELLVEVVVAGWHRRMHGVEGRGTDHFEGLVEGQTFLNVVAQALQVAKCGMAFVAVVDVLLDAELLEQKHTAYAEENLLLQSVLPVTAVECVCDGFVEF